MRYELELIERAAERFGLLDLRAVAAVGLSEAQWARLRRDDIWLPVVPGLWRHAATPLNWTMQVRAGAVWLGRDAALHGECAGAWLGLDGCSASTAAFLLPRTRRNLAPWLELHTTKQWHRGDFVVRDGVRTSTATRAIIDMAARVTPRQLEAAIDDAMRRRLTSVPTLTRRSRELAGSGRPGTQMLRAVLLDSGGESVLERAFLRLVRQRRLPRPSSQVVYRREGGSAIRVDFEYIGRNVVVEVTGRLGHASDRERQRDARRRNELQRSGKVVVEFTTADVLQDPDYVERTLIQHLHVGRFP